MAKNITILLSGACGSGKTSLARSAREILSPIFNEVASIDVDFVYNIVDPFYSLRDEVAEPYWKLARQNCALLAHNYFAHDFKLVVINGNCIYLHEQVNDVIRDLFSVSQVFHFTLNPSVDTIKSRVKARGDENKSSEWLEEHVLYMRKHYYNWTSLIDNSELTVVQTWQLILDKISLNEGKIENVLVS